MCTSDSYFSKVFKDLVQTSYELKTYVYKNTHPLNPYKCVISENAKKKGVGTILI